MRIHRRTMLKLAGAGLIFPHTLGSTRNLWGQAPSGPKAYALHIGLNNVDSRAYNGRITPLHGCTNDARSMQAITQAQGVFGSKIRLLGDDPRKPNELATIRNVIGHILWAAKDLHDGDLFVVTYAGHGGQVRDTLGDETDDHYDETWCLFDGQLRDDILYATWSQFDPGVRILVISDSCHSGTVARDQAFAASIARGIDDTSNTRTRNGLGLGTGSTVRLRGLSGGTPVVEGVKNRALAIAQNGRGGQQSDEPEPDPNQMAFRSLTPEEANRAYLGRQRDYEQTNEPVLTFGDTRAAGLQVRASGLLLAACQDRELSIELGGHGLFTTRLRETWNSGRFDGTSYHEFLTAIGRRMPPEQRPNFFPFGANNDRYYYQQKPFGLT